jgi:hypothetical protein
LYDQQTGSAGTSPFIRRNGRSNWTGADQQQAFVLNMVAQSPKFTNTWMRRLAGDWQFAPILILGSGPYYSVIPDDRSGNCDDAYIRDRHILRHKLRAETRRQT